MFTSKGMWIGLIVTGLVIAALYFAGRARSGGSAGAGPAKAREPTEVYLGLRSRALATSAKEMDVPVTPSTPVVYGVVWDLSMASGTATIVSFSTGDTSMYTSTGGGIIGGIGHETCRTASKQFIAVAQTQLAGMKKTEVFPIPPTGIFRFYVLTTEGVYMAEDKEEVITKRKGPWAALFMAGDNVITQLRLTAPKR